MFTEVVRQPPHMRFVQPWKMAQGALFVEDHLTVGVKLVIIESQILDMNKGYTVLELLVVIAIIGTLMGVGYANYRGYAQSQSIVAASRALRSDLRLAQEQATGGQKPAGCTGTLIGYEFNVISSTTYEINARCTTGAVLIKSVTVPTGITITAPSVNPILFKALAQGTNVNGFVVVGLTQQTTNNYAGVQISDAGNIEENFATPRPSGQTPPPEGGGFANYITDQNTVGFWHMDESSGSTASDSSGKGNNGSVTGNVVTGKLGNARQFSGGYLRAAGVPVNTSGFNTVDFWMKWSGGSAAVPFAWDTTYFLDFFSSCFGFNTNNGEIYGVNTSIIPVNQWVYVAAVFPNGYPASGGQIYINGTARTLSYCYGSSSRSLQVTSSFWAGSYGGQFPFSGVVDEVAISNIARTGTEIQGAYQYGLTHN